MPSQNKSEQRALVRDLQDFEAMIRNRHEWAEITLDRLRAAVNITQPNSEAFRDLHEIVDDIQSDYEIAIERCVLLRHVLDKAKPICAEGPLVIRNPEREQKK